MIIVKQAELKGILTGFCEQNVPEIVGNDFFVLGTMDRKDWKKGQTGEMSQQEAIKLLFPFKDAWDFEVIPDVGYTKEQVKSRSRNNHKNNHG